MTVHRAYLEAGADAIKTNTFGLPRMAAAQNPMWEAMADEGWKLAAQAAAKTSAAVFADLGPATDTEALPAAQIYTALAERFAALGAKNFLFETLSSDAGVAEAARQIKEAVPDAFVLVSFAVLPDGYTREGRHCAELVRSMTACGAVDAVGLNCVSAPGAMRALVQQLGETELPLAVMPNAGYPVVTRTRCSIRAGRNILHGSWPALLPRVCVFWAAAAALRLPTLRPCVRHWMPCRKHCLQPRQQQSPLPQSRRWKKTMLPAQAERGQKVIAIELDSPKDADLTGYLDGARRLQAAGADLLTIADCPIARARMDSSLVACRVHRELGLNVLPHMTCRDRNLNATKALLLGLYAEGVREVLAITGDPIPTAERDEVKNVYQFNSRKLAQYIVSLAGEGREMPSPLTVFGALNLTPATLMWSCAAHRKSCKMA